MFFQYLYGSLVLSVSIYAAEICFQFELLQAQPFCFSGHNEVRNTFGCATELDTFSATAQTWTYIYMVGSVDLHIICTWLGAWTYIYVVGSMDLHIICTWLGAWTYIYMVGSIELHILQNRPQLGLRC